MTKAIAKRLRKLANKVEKESVIGLAFVLVEGEEEICLVANRNKSKFSSRSIQMGLAMAAQQYSALSPQEKATCRVH